MKKPFLTFAAIALVFSFTSCNETTETSTETEEIKTEIPAEVTPVEVDTPTEEVDSLTTQAEVVEDKVIETPAI